MKENLCPSDNLIIFLFLAFYVCGKAGLGASLGSGIYWFEDYGKASPHVGISSPAGSYKENLQNEADYKRKSAISLILLV